MKTPIFFFLSFFLIAFSITPLSFAEQQSPEEVRDTDGKFVRAGTNYYIIPVFRGQGGGVTLRSIRNETCPFDVIQETNELKYGHPLTFTPVNPKKGVIRISSDLNIKFSDSITICLQSPVWKLDDDKGETVVSTNGVEGNPGIETVSNWFKIEKCKLGDYKLVFCPSVCNTCKVRCSDIGVVNYFGNRRLVLSQKPFRVKFKKA